MNHFDKCIIADFKLRVNYSTSLENNVVENKSNIKLITNRPKRKSKHTLHCLVRIY